MKITFDTNTLSGVIDPSRWAGKPEHRAYRAVHEAVKTGQVRGFFCEAAVALDAIYRKEKVETIGAARLVRQTTAAGPNRILISIGSRWKRTVIDQQFLDRIQAARDLGMRALIGPRRFGDSLVVTGFGDDFYEPYPSGPAFEAAASKANAVDAAIVRTGLGRAVVINLARYFSARAGAENEWWPQGLERSRSNSERERARQAINEWADGEAVAAHAGYGNNLFCTADKGGGLGKGSVLHPRNRVWLSGTYGIVFVTIDEVAVRVGSARVGVDNSKLPASFSGEEGLPPHGKL